MSHRRPSGGTSQRSTRGGYDAVFRPELDRKYMCPICLVAMKDAVQTCCGHRFCELCIEEVASGFDGDQVKCPVDNEWFSWTGELFVDNAVRREILSLSVLCYNHTNGCSWSGELRDVEDHVSNCGFLIIPCENGCSEMVLKRDRQDHDVNCSHRRTSCGHCGQSVMYMDLTRHEVLECEMFPVRCTLCGQWGIKRQDIQHHLDKDSGDCPQGIINCPYQKYGCQYQDKRQNMMSHEKDATGLHLTYVESRVSSQDSQLATLSQKIINLSGKLEERVSQYETILREIVASQSTNYTGVLQQKIQLVPGCNKYTSPSFYTGIPGYKLSVSIEFREDPSYAALFVHLDKGQYDHEIIFPLHAVCRVTLMAQSPTARNYQRDIVCRNMARCRTEGEMLSTQRGLLKFIPVDKLKSEDFCKDGAFFMHIQINQEVDGSY